MKKYTLDVDGNSYMVMADSMQDLEESFGSYDIVGDDGEIKSYSGFPEVWKNNLDKIVETDITAEIEKQKIKDENIALLQDLLSEPEIAEELLAKYRTLLAEKRGN